MLILNYTEVPATEAEDINHEHTTWRDGHCVVLDEGTHVTLFIFHREKEVTEMLPDSEEPAVRQGMEAFAVRVAKPMTRDMAINAAEMTAYGLSTAMEVASFNASLARKSRADASDAEVYEHDLFISNVKAELTKIGV